MNRWRLLFAVVVAAVMVMLYPVHLAAQTQTTGDITGTVTDPSAATVPDAKVTLKSVEKGWTQESKTNTSGVYRFSLTSPGNFTVTVAASGFQPQTKDATVYLGQVTPLDFQLKLAAAAQTVTVTEAMPLLQTENGNLAATVIEKQVQEMPNPGNDLTYAAQIAPGSVMNTQTGYGNFSSFGLPGNSNTFTINGMDNNDPYLNLNNSGATNLMLGLNEVQEVSVVTNGYSGQYGGLAGANVNYITRSGGNEFHGTARYFWNGRRLNANDWLNNSGGAPRAFSNANQWGGDFGGPIKRNKLFFYFDTEGLRVLLPATPVPVRVPTVPFENATIANLAAKNLTKSIPFYQNIFALYNNAPGISRAVNIAPNAACTALVGPGVSCRRSFSSSPPANLTWERTWSVRGDWNWSKNGRLFVRYLNDNGLQATGTDVINKVFNTSSPQPQHVGQLIETHNFGPKATNQFILSASWYQAVFDLADPAGALAAFAPALSFRDGSFAALNPTQGFPQGRIATQAQLSDDFARTVGDHTLKFGVKYRRNDITDLGFQNRVRGRIRPTLTDFFNGGVGSPAALATTFEQRFPITGTEQRFKFYTLGGYAEDSWRATPNFTLTFALRVEHSSNPVCKALCFSYPLQPFLQLNPDPSIPYSQFMGTGQRVALLGLTNLEWQPRVGFAWQPLGGRHNLVIRGGMGIFYDGFQNSVASNFALNPPNSNRFNISPGFAISPDETAGPGGFTLFSAARLMNQLYVTGFKGGLTVGQIRASLPPALQPFFNPPTLATAEAFTNEPQYQKWSLEVQKGLWRNASASVSYVGSHGIHETVQNGGLNAGVGAGFAGLPATRRDARFLNVLVFDTNGISNYHGMVLSFRQRLASGLLQVNYTWSRAMDLGGGLSPFNLDSNSSITTQEDPNNLHRQYGPADWDVKHYLSATYVWEVPFKWLLRGHGPNALLKGWQVAGTVFARSGLPFTAIDGDTSSRFTPRGYTGTLFANYAGNGVVSCQSLDPTQPPLNVCLDPNKLGVTDGSDPNFPVAGFSKLGRNTFRGPNYFTTDFTIMKLTKIPRWERGELGIGFQFFNVFNHPNFDQAVQDLGSPLGFGTIASTVGSPTSILGSFLGGDASPRIIQLKLQFKF